ncbi:MAG: hypothetical protein ACODAD_11685 [Planctomycetota bacterium]
MKRAMGTAVTIISAILLLTGWAAAEQSRSRLVNTSEENNKADTSKKSSEPTQQVNPAEQGRRAEQEPVTERTQEVVDPSPEEKQRATAAQHAASAAEQQFAAKVQKLQTLMKKEEQDLAQRLAYAARLRNQGLEKSDQALLKQAEQFERRALEYYQKRVEQFEKLRIPTEGDANSKLQQRRQPSQKSRSSSLRQRSRLPSRARYSDQSDTRTRRYYRRNRQR